MFRSTLAALGLAALSLSAAAEGTLATMPNRDGGLIRFTDYRCYSDQYAQLGYTRYVTANVRDGRTITGCWKWNSSDFTASVVWSDGQIYTYESSDFTFTEYAESRQNRKAARRSSSSADL